MRRQIKILVQTYLALFLILCVGGFVGILYSLGDSNRITGENVKSFEISSEEGNVYYVSPVGNDLNEGTFERPFLTIQKAKETILELKNKEGITEPINVFLREGTYYLEDILFFSSQDSGTSSFPITYQAYPKEKVIISGGQELDLSWSDENSDGIYVADIGNLEFNSLYVDEEPAIRAREPDISEEKPYYEFYGINPDTKYIAFNFSGSEINSSWKNLKDIEVISYRRWRQSRMKIDRIEGQKVFFNGELAEDRGYDWDYGPGGRYYVENCLECLDEPGEWYLDKEDKKLYYFPIEDISKSKFVIPRLEGFIDACSQNYIEIEENDLFDLQNSGTISVWSMPLTDYPSEDESIKFRPLVSKSSSGSNSSEISYFIDWYGNNSSRTLRAAISNDTQIDSISISNFDFENDWVHIVYTWNGSHQILYLDNQIVRIQEQKTIPSKTDLEVTIGKEFGSGSHLWNGKIDEVHIWNKSLNSSEVELLYNSNTYSSEGLVASYSFEDNLLDNSNNFNNATLTGVLSYSSGKFGKSANLENSNEGLSNVKFRGFIFQDADWNMDPLGYYRGGFGSYSTPSINFCRANDVSFENNTIRNTGFYALGGSDNSNLKIRYNKIYNLGSGGIYLRGTVFNHKRTSFSNLIEQNKIYNVGRVYSESFGIVSYNDMNTSISNNEIYNVGYTGLSQSIEKDKDIDSEWIPNKIENNLIHDTMQDLNDGGAIYCSGMQHGTSISNNIVYNVQPTKKHLYPNYGLCGIYLDEGGQYFTIKDNIVYENGINLNIHKSYNNFITNNIFVDSYTYDLAFRGRGTEDYAIGVKGNNYTRNIIYSNRTNTNLIKIYLDSVGNINWSLNNLNYSDYNFFYTTNSSKDSWNLDWWKTQGFDLNSHFLNPSFIDYDQQNFSLNESSPVFSLGFEEIDTSNVGPVDVECFEDSECNSNQKCIQMTCVEYPIEKVSQNTKTGSSTSEGTNSIRYGVDKESEEENESSEEKVHLSFEEETPEKDESKNSNKLISFIILLILISSFVLISIFLLKKISTGKIKKKITKERENQEKINNYIRNELNSYS